MENNLFAKHNGSIDMLRGLTMLLMVFVNDLWSVTDVPHFLEHISHGEDGMGVADAVFPMFLFAMGMSIPYAIERRFAKGYTGESTLGHILSRSFALILMGVFIVNSETDFTSTVGYGYDAYRLLMVAAFFMIWNQYKKDSKIKKWLQMVGVATQSFLAITYRTHDGGFLKASWWGILGIIGWTYCFCATAYLLARKKPVYLAVLWGIVCVVNLLTTKMRGGGQPIPGPSFLSDLAGALRLGNGCFAVMTLGGILLSLAENRLSGRFGSVRLALAGASASVLAVVATVLHHWWIVSKLGGTLPWCLYVTVISIVLYMILRVLEAYGKTAWFRPVNVSGTATLTVYMMPYILYSINSIVGLYPYGSLSGPLGLLKCVVFSFLCVLVTSLSVRLGIRLKI